MAHHNNLIQIFIELTPLLSLLNPFHATGLFLYPLKTSEKQRFSEVFRCFQGVSKWTSGMKWVNICLIGNTEYLIVLSEKWQFSPFQSTIYQTNFSLRQVLKKIKICFLLLWYFYVAIAIIKNKILAEILVFSKILENDTFVNRVNRV